MGYIGAQRSTNSKIAIEHYELPLSMVTKDVIGEYLDSDECRECGFTPEQIETLRSTPVAMWKYAAKRFGHTSWHHTGAYYRKTKHYDLTSVADHLLNDSETLSVWLDRDRMQKAEAAQQAREPQYGWCKYEIWDGTRTHPHMAGYGTAVGTINGDWLREADGTRHKLSARKTVDYKRFATLETAKEYDKGMKG